MMGFNLLLCFCLSLLGSSKSKRIIYARKIKFEPSRGWLSWEPWTPCSLLTYCRSGTRSRQRKCEDPNGNCSGAYIDSEDCPTEDCLDNQAYMISDVAQASTSSFISAECNTDIKYSFMSPNSPALPIIITHYIQRNLRQFRHGYFNLQRYQGDETNELRDVTKYCFEPYHMTLKDAANMWYYNRVTKATLYAGAADGDQQASRYVSGIVIAIDTKTNELRSAYFAMPSERIGYKTIHYKRWKGKSQGGAYPVSQAL